MQVKQRDNEIDIMVSMLKGRNRSSQGTAAAAATAAADAAVFPSSSGKGPAEGGGGAEVLSALLDAHLLADRHKAFEVFRKSYKHGEVSASANPQTA